MPAADCIFCKIASGEIPSIRIFEDSGALAFLDIGPLSPGHTLLIPKQHYTSLLDVPRDVLTSLASHLPALARAVMKATGASGLNVLQNTGESAGQAVFHLHIHLIPRTEGDGLGYRWNAGTYGEGEAQSLQSKILQQLEAG